MKGGYMNTTTLSVLTELIEKLRDAQADAEKFDAGNKSAGTRLRAAMQETKVKAQEIRTMVSEIKNS